MPHIPIEICERVIDDLHDQRHTLLACALTCHAWLPRSRYHLFHNFEIWSYDEVNRLDRLRTERPQLSALVKQLTVVHSYESDVLQMFPATLAQALPSVAALHIASCCSPPISLNATFLRTVSHFAAVAELHLDRLRFIGLADVARLVCALPALAVLRCRRLRTLGYPAADLLDPRDPADPPLRLKSFAIDASLMAPLVAWLLTAASPAHLECLAFYDLDSPAALQCAAALVAAAGPALRHLTLGLAPPCARLPEHALHAHLPLARAPGLRTLHVEARADDGALVRAVLRAARGLRGVRVAVDVDGARLLAGAGLDALLAGVGAGGALVLRARTDVDVEWLRAELPRCMPEAVARGMVWVEQR
ncbi:hypothetical protein B0H21DRAFT_824489 [Amylocystis lapponica]|nr:hypothetical protein B0H21DRAFT_824489 [Amylocystis lapponica]